MSIPFLLNFFALSSFSIIGMILVSSSIIQLSESSPSPSPSPSPSYELAGAAAYLRRSFKKVQYGSACNSSVKCDIHSLLTCEDSTCQCLYPDAMTYSAELGTCVSLVNEICGYLETKQVFINCLPNSLCDQHQGVCKCVQGYVELGRSCVKQKTFGEGCHSDSECLTDLSLICFEEICQCDPEQYVPLYTSQDQEDDIGLSSSSTALSNSPVKCVALAGLPCTAKTGCVPKASCVSEAESGSGMDGVKILSWLHPGICQCNLGYEADRDGYCRGEYGAYCDVLGNVTCSEKFHCLDGICHCKYSDDQAYHGDIGECVSLVGGPCPFPPTGENDGNETEVIASLPTASCGKFMECRNGSCVCKEGFAENKERGCDLSFGQPCAGKTMSKCDKAAGLHCVNGRCACKDDMRIFDGVVGKCVGKAGASCLLPISGTECHRKQQGVLRGRNAINRNCDQDAICQVSRLQLRGLSENGVCMHTFEGLSDTGQSKEESEKL